VKQEDSVQKLLQANAHFIRIVWCSLPLYLVEERGSHTSFISTTLQHMTTSTNCVQMKEEGNLYLLTPRLSAGWLLCILDCD